MERITESRPFPAPRSTARSFWRPTGASLGIRGRLLGFRVSGFGDLGVVGVSGLGRRVFRGFGFRVSGFVEGFRGLGV